MAAAANALGFLAIPGPLNIQFGLTGMPLLLTAFVLGPSWGFVCGLLGGITQAQKCYGNLLYVGYTAIQGGVAGYFAQDARLTRRVGPFFALVGGFCTFWWIDLLRTSKFTLQHLGDTKFSEASVASAPTCIPVSRLWNHRRCSGVRRDSDPTARAIRAEIKDSSRAGRLLGRRGLRSMGRDLSFIGSRVIHGCRRGLSSPKTSYKTSWRRFCSRCSCKTSACGWLFSGGRARATQFSPPCEPR